MPDRPVARHFERIILGIDPGTNILGYALIGINGASFELIDMGYLTMSKLEDHVEKLKYIAEELQILIRRHKPDELAIEAPFYGKNVQSMLKLGRAQGVAMAIAITQGVRIHEYSPKKIKQSVTGNGNASKETVAAVAEQILKRPLPTDKLDATDALATALCHYFQRITAPGLSGKNKKNNWEGFLKDNPERIVGRPK